MIDLVADDDADDDDGALTCVELGVRFVLTTSVAEITLLGPVRQVFDMTNVQRAIELQARIEAAKTITLGRDFGVVPGRERLQMHP